MSSLRVREGNFQFQTLHFERIQVYSAFRSLRKHCPSVSWYLYEMVTQIMLRTHAGKSAFFFEKTNPICDNSRSNQLPLIDRTAVISP